MDLVEITLNEEMGDGIFAISLVDRPATERDWVFLSAETVAKMEFAEIDPEKRIIAGAILTPNKFILRKDANGDPYQVFFKPDTVAKASEIFMKEKRQSDTTIGHQIPVKGVTLVQSWITQSEDVDTYKTYQPDITLPVGTWYGVMKIDDENIWNEIKNGTFKGFSIEMLGTEKNINMKSLLQKFNDLKDGITKPEKTDHQFVSVTTTDGTVIVSDDEEFTVGNPIFAEVDGERIPLAPGEYETESAAVLVVVDEGILAEVRDAAEVSTEDEEIVEMKSQIAGLNNALESVLDILTKMDEKFSAVDSKQKSELAELELKIVELSKPVSKTIEQKPNGQTNNVVKFESLDGKSQAERIAILRRNLKN